MPLLGLARGVLRRRAAGAAHRLGAETRGGTGALWRERRAAVGDAARAGLGDVFRGDLLRLTVAVTLMNACTMFAWWGFNQWIPAYLSLPPADGGLGLEHADDVRASSSRCRSACGSAT